METRKRVEYLLKNYHDIKRNMEVLLFEIERFTGISYDEMLEAMVFAKVEGERVSNSSISDKTSRIALIYRELTDKQNDEALKCMIAQYFEIKAELDLLDYCLPLLSAKLSQVITDMYIKRLSWSELCGKYYVSQTMLGKYRRKAIGDIVIMFEMRKAV